MPRSGLNVRSPYRDPPASLRRPPPNIRPALGPIPLRDPALHADTDYRSVRARTSASGASSRNPSSWPATLAGVGHPAAIWPHMVRAHDDGDEARPATGPEGHRCRAGGCAVAPVLQDEVSVASVPRQQHAVDSTRPPTVDDIGRGILGLTLGLRPN